MDTISVVCCVNVPQSKKRFFICTTWLRRQDSRFSTSGSGLPREWKMIVGSERWMKSLGKISAKMPKSSIHLIFIAIDLCALHFRWNCNAIDCQRDTSLMRWDLNWLKMGVPCGVYTRWRKDFWHQIFRCLIIRLSGKRRRREKPVNGN